MDQRSDLYENQFQEAGPGRRAVRRGRGGQYASVSRIRQPVRASAAHGQCHLRRVPGPGLRRGRGLPGSRCGALLCGLVYWKTRNLPATLAGEVFGTGIIGGLLSYPVAVAFMGVVAGSIAFYAYVVPFLVSTVGGSILAGILVFTLQKSGALKSMRAALEH